MKNSTKKTKPNLLLHICCAGCGAYVSELLSKGYNVTLFFYNPNINTDEEYLKRLNEVQKVAKNFHLPLIAFLYNHSAWKKLIKGYEKEPEKGKRCYLCYRDRLKMTAKTAKDNGFNFFTTTLTVSPHKLASAIFMIGQQLSLKYKVDFLSQDFKKQDGFKKAAAMSHDMNLDRQDYCGCEFSVR